MIGHYAIWSDRHRPKVVRITRATAKTVYAEYAGQREMRGTLAHILAHSPDEDHMQRTLAKLRGITGEAERRRMAAGAWEAAEHRRILKEAME